ncbi:conserved exported hypothetical protein [Flavobacterium sp. 9AF]|uniref:DUF6252 family protein n=1 Tax=Flavobacterium sp. 9AF TaxID=2653142 RepID=UPI0012F13734|nr:DUF6252 family protein [Flavobacterium sp. 9AF]VXB22759.1 conserved exported hypothetical protein [Flavobacterium sp. 9AF]
MKKIVALFGCVLLLTSCVNETQINNPAFQAKFNDANWKSQETSLSIGANGGLIITALRGNEKLVLTTSAANPGTYILGTTNQANFGTYTLKSGTNTTIFDTGAFPGPAFLTRKLTSGNAYSASTSALTTGGSGSGLVFKITVNNLGAIVTDTIKARGANYLAGDVVTVDGGNNNATFRVLNTQQSNGEVVIQKVENGTYTGTFKLNAVDDDGQVVTFSEGIFYRLPIN